MKNSWIVLVILFFFACNTSPEKQTEEETSYPEFSQVNFTYSDIKGIGHEKGCTRRDPSDVIKIEDTYYVYYTKVYGRSPGYWGTIWYASSKDEGYTWEEQGEVLGVGKEGTFDSQAVFTPNIIYALGKFCLYYTGVKPTPGRTDGVFENNSTTDITALGLAISDNPGGPFERFSDRPILEVSKEAENFDSYRIDDAALMVRYRKYWLYYKGRSRAHGAQGPGHTQMGVAFSDHPKGPFIPYGSPLLPESHEVMIWPLGQGVGALASISSTMVFASDGIDFLSNKRAIKVENRPNAPGAYRPDLTDSKNKGQGLKWGISMVHNGAESYLVRFQVDPLKM